MKKYLENNLNFISRAKAREKAWENFCKNNR
jgi:hypothetical protein